MRQSHNMNLINDIWGGLVKFNVYIKKLICFAASNKMYFIIMTSSITSIQIPFVFTNISEERIIKTFQDLGWAKDNDIRLDIVARTNKHGQDYNVVFVHFNNGWNENTKDAETALLEGKEIKITYDKPWYWRIRLNKSHKHTAEEIEAFNKANDKAENKPAFQIMD